MSEEYINSKLHTKAGPVLLLIFFSFSLIVLSSCESSASLGTKGLIIDNSNIPPGEVTELPTVKYNDPGIKYELESMLLHNFPIVEDDEASGGYAVHLIDESSEATLKVQFPAGTYECLLKEKAPDVDHSAFYVYIDNTPYRVYAGNPPSNAWELTVRAPIVFTLKTDNTVLITIRANAEGAAGDTGMNLDCIQFIKRK